MTGRPDLPGHAAPAGFGDQVAAWPVAEREDVFASPYLSLRRDRIVAPTGLTHQRVVVDTVDAVAVLAISDDDQILLVDQYRHAVGRRMVELPAGKLDVPGEEPRATAARELAEEADLRAAHWERLVEVRASPGYTVEAMTVFRATDLTPVPVHERTVREAEEADLHQWWVDFDEAVTAVLAGRLTNSMTVAAILAEHARRTRS